MRIAKILCAAAVCLAFGSVKAHASEANYSIGYSSYASVGVRCSSNTAIQINASRPSGFTSNVAQYVITNLDASNRVFIGGVNVSTASALGDTLTNLGAPIAASGSKTVQVGKTYSNAASPLIPIYCKASDAAGASGSVIAVEWFGY